MTLDSRFTLFSGHRAFGLLTVVIVVFPRFTPASPCFASIVQQCTWPLLCALNRLGIAGSNLGINDQNLSHRLPTGKMGLILHNQISTWISTLAQRHYILSIYISMLYIFTRLKIPFREEWRFDSDRPHQNVLWEKHGSELSFGSFLSGVQCTELSSPHAREMTAERPQCWSSES